MKIRSAVPENGCLIFYDGRKKQKKTKTNICKTYTHPPHRRLRKQEPQQQEQEQEKLNVRSQWGRVSTQLGFTLSVVGVVRVLVANAPNFEGAKGAKFRRKPPFCLFRNKVGCPPCQYKKFKRKIYL